MRKRKYPDKSVVRQWLATHCAKSIVDFPDCERDSLRVMSNVGDKTRAVEEFECGCVRTEHLGTINGREEPYTVIQTCKAHKPKMQIIEFQIDGLD